MGPYKNRTYHALERLDDGHEIQVAIDISEDQLTIDFAGTSSVHPFNLNANISIVYSAVIYVLRLLCEKEIPLNEGLMKRLIHLNLLECIVDEFDDTQAKIQILLFLDLQIQ